MRVSVRERRRATLGAQHHRHRPDARLRGLSRLAPLRGNGWPSRSKDFSAAGQRCVRDLGGIGAAVPRQHHQPGTNDLVAGFDERQISTDGKNEQPSTTTGGSVRLRWGLGRPGAVLDRRLRARQGVQPRRHRRWLRRGVRAALGTGFSFSSETADGMPKHQQWTQEFRLESSNAGHRSTGRVASTTSTRTTRSRLQLRLRSPPAARRTAATLAPEERRLRDLRRRQLRG